VKKKKPKRIVVNEYLIPTMIYCVIFFVFISWASYRVITGVEEYIRLKQYNKVKFVNEVALEKLKKKIDLLVRRVDDMQSKKIDRDWLRMIGGGR